jgi:hypothetical protein
MLLRAMFLALVVTITGCGEEDPPTNTAATNMSTDGYDKTCAAAADCILVFTGNVCGCGCTQQAIAATEGARYAAEQEEKRKECTDVLSCQPCQETQQAVCEQGTCNAVAK